MKTIVLWNSDAIAGGATPDLSAGVDSAVLRHGEPLFVDGATERSLVCPAVRIGRLGTHIPERVARSYADAMTVFHLLIPEPPVAAKTAAWGLADRTFAPGAFVPLAEGVVEICAEKYPIAFGKNCSEGCYSTFDTALTAPAIAAISAICTLRTGDVIVFADHGLNMGPAMPDHFIDAEIDGEQVLHLKIK